jgi:hypothetical protein
MLTTRYRNLTAIAAGALVLTALAGCGSDDKTTDADAKAASSASSSPSESSSATADPSDAADDVDLSGAAGPGERLTKDNLVATMLAAMRAKKTAHMEMEIGSSVGADADVRYSGDGTDMRMSMDIGPTKAEVILVDGVVYMQQSAGAKYVKIDKDTPGNTVGLLSGLSPDSSIAAMDGALKKVEYAGTAKVDGDTVSKYHVTADAAAMADSLGGASALGDLPDTVNYDLYVDHDQLMRRIDMDLDDQMVKVLISDWGKAVDIKAPAASEVLSQ